MRHNPFAAGIDSILTRTLDRSGNEIRSLVPVFADYPCEEVNAKYESVASPESDVQLQVSPAARNPALLSPFAM